MQILTTATELVVGDTMAVAEDESSLTVVDRARVSTPFGDMIHLALSDSTTAVMPPYAIIGVMKREDLQETKSTVD